SAASPISAGSSASASSSSPSEATCYSGVDTCQLEVDRAQRGPGSSLTETISQDDHDLPSSFSYPAAPAPKRPKKDPKAAADWVPPAAAKPKPSTGNGGVPPPYAENTVPPETPNTLESAFSGDTNSLRNIHESL